jgi:opacity protein-like surface antigen
MRIFAAAAAIAFAVSTTGSALAGSEGAGEGFYVGGGASAVQLSDVDFNNGSNGTNRTAEFDVGVGVNLRGGYDFGLIRADLELGYTNADVDSVSGATDGSGEANLYTVMVRGTADFDVGNGFSPYISLGAGAMGAEGDIAFTDSDGVLQTKNFYGVAPAASVGVGLGYALSDSAAAVLGYQLNGAYTDDTNEDQFILAHAVRLGLNFKF